MPRTQDFRDALFRKTSPFFRSLWPFFFEADNGLQALEHLARLQNEDAQLEKLGPKWPTGGLSIG